MVFLSQRSNRKISPTSTSSNFIAMKGLVIISLLAWTTMVLAAPAADKPANIAGEVEKKSGSVPDGLLAFNSDKDMDTAAYGYYGGYGGYGGWGGYGGYGGYGWGRPIYSGYGGYGWGWGRPYGGYYGGYGWGGYGR